MLYISSVCAHGRTDRLPDGQMDKGLLKTAVLFKNIERCKNGADIWIYWHTHIWYRTNCMHFHICHNIHIISPQGPLVCLFAGPLVVPDIYITRHICLIDNYDNNGWRRLKTALSYFTNCITYGEIPLSYAFLSRCTVLNIMWLIDTLRMNTWLMKNLLSNISRILDFRT